MSKKYYSLIVKEAARGQRREEESVALLLQTRVSKRRQNQMERFLDIYRLFALSLIQAEGKTDRRRRVAVAEGRSPSTHIDKDFVP